MQRKGIKNSSSGKHEQSSVATTIDNFQSGLVYSSNMQPTVMLSMQPEVTVQKTNASHHRSRMHKTNARLVNQINCTYSRKEPETDKNQKAISDSPIAQYSITDRRPIQLQANIT